jgi:Aromatic-ring-opening dioxygenase LigAB, LigA subunit
MSVTALRDFVVGVATDPDLAMRFAADPAAELERFELTDEEKTAVLARDSAQLRVALGAPRKGASTANNDRKKKTGRKGSKKSKKPRKKR